LVLLIVVTLSKFGGYFGILRLMRPALVLFALCVGYALLHPNKIILTNLHRSVTVRLLVGIGLVVVCSAVFGISLGRAAVFILDNFSKTLAITFLMIVTVRDLKDLRRLTWAFAFASILLAFLSIFVIGISKVSTGVSYDANDVGVLMVMSLPLALLFVQSASTRTERIMAIVGIGLVAATLVKTQSRGAFIGALVVCPALLLMPGVAASRRFLFVAAAVLTMVFAAPSGYWTSMQSILADPKADYNWDAVNGRRNIARRGMGYMVMYPVFGVGINNFPMAEGTISEKARNLVRGQGIRWAAPHNSFVQAGAEAGVTGLLLWVSLIIANVMIPLRLARRIPKAWRKGTPDQRFLSFATLYLPIAQLGFAVTSFFVSFAWLEPLYFFSALVAGLAMIVARELGPITAVNHRTGFRSRRSSTLPGLTSQPTAGPNQTA
jgi:O-antigen ligase/polysaccharide polymerase Wzy-like membrane protein